MHAHSYQVLKQCEDMISSLTTDTMKVVFYEIISSHDIDREVETFNNSIKNSSAHVRTELDDLTL